MIFLLFTPVQCIWLMGIAIAAGKRIGKPTGFLQLLLVINAMLTSLVVMLALVPAIRFELQHSAAGFMLVIATVVFRLLLIPVLFSRITVRAERIKKPECDSAIRFSDYIWRFFAFAYLPLTIWSVQSMVAAELKSELKNKQR